MHGNGAPRSPQPSLNREADTDVIQWNNPGPPQAKEPPKAGEEAAFDRVQMFEKASISVVGNPARDLSLLI